MSIKKNPADLTLRDIGESTSAGIKWGMRKVLTLGLKTMEKAKDITKEAMEEAKEEMEKDDNAIDVKGEMVDKD